MLTHLKKKLSPNFFRTSSTPKMYKPQLLVSDSLKQVFSGHSRAIPITRLALFRKKSFKLVSKSKFWFFYFHHTTTNNEIQWKNKMGHYLATTAYNCNSSENGKEVLFL